MNGESESYDTEPVRENKVEETKSILQQAIYIHDIGQED